MKYQYAEFYLFPYFCQTIRLLHSLKLWYTYLCHAKLRDRFLSFPCRCTITKRTLIRQWIRTHQHPNLSRHAVRKSSNNDSRLKVKASLVVAVFTTAGGRLQMTSARKDFLHKSSKKEKKKKWKKAPPRVKNPVHRKTPLRASRKRKV